MKISTGFASFAAVVSIVAVLTFSPLPDVAAAAGASLDAERTKGEQLVKTLHIQEALGPLAPVALSPFFALTCLSGASLLADSGLLPDMIAKNALLGHDSVLNNGFVFAGLLALTLITAAPKLTKVTKPFAQAVDQLEGHAGIVAVIAVQLLANLQLGEPEAEKVAVVYQAGVVSFSMTTLVAVFSAINIFVVNTVKFFFEVLIFLSPFPAVDAVFEAMNKAAVAALVSLYVLSPWLATVVNLLIFAICLLVFAWIYRRVVYMRSVLGDPFFGWLAESVFRRPRITPTATHLPTKAAAALPDARLVLKAFAGRGYEAIKRKARGYLVLSGGRLHFVVTRFLRAPLIVALPGEGHHVNIEKGLLSNTVRFENASGDTTMKVIFTRRYNDILGAIRQLVGERAVSAEEATTSRRVILEAGRAVGAAVKGAGRESVRAEFA